MLILANYIKKIARLLLAVSVLIEELQIIIEQAVWEILKRILLS